MAPGGKALGLPRGRLHGKQLLAGWMKVALLAVRRGRRVGGCDSPPTDSNKQVIKIRRRKKKKKKKSEKIRRWERWCVKVKERERGKAKRKQEKKRRERRKERRKNQQLSGSLTTQGCSSELACKR